MINKIAVFALLFCPFFSYTLDLKQVSQSNSEFTISDFPYEQRLELMKADMTLRFLTEYTLEYHIALPIQEMVKAKDNPDITKEQRAILVGLVIKMREKGFLLRLLEKKNCFEYAYCYKKQQQPSQEIEAEDQAYGSILSQCFDIIISQSEHLDQAYIWAYRIMTCNPYTDYLLEEKDVKEFYDNPPVQPHLHYFWQAMWQK